MLTRLRIKQLGVIDEAVVEPAPGLTAVTGETGAGKTMVVSGMGLLLGERAEAGVVRNGADLALVEGCFSHVEKIAGQLDDLGADIDDGELIVARQVRSTGRSRAWLGGAQVPIGVLSSVTGELATIHGQMEQVRLGTAERQREILDRFGGEKIAHELAVYQDLFAQRRSAQTELDERVENARERAREHDVLAFGLAEIEKVSPQLGEDKELAAEAEKLQALDELRSLAQLAHHGLSGADDGDVNDPGAAGLIGDASKNVARIAELDSNAAELAEAIGQLLFQAQDAAANVASYLADLPADPHRLETITSRRAELAELTRKYGENIEAVLGWAEDASQRIADLGDDEQRITQLHEQIAELTVKLTDSASKLHTLRNNAATKLAGQVAEELTALAMPHARLEFQLTVLDELSVWGGDKVELLFSANPGTEPAPLARTASGGELSRVRLALEVVLAGTDPGHTFIFDEVDAGVGGQVATEIGRRLARLAQHSQVFVVTHLAQVAAFADRHYVVAKSSDGQVTNSDVQLAEGDARLAEIARLMAGSQSDTALAHAKELLAQTFEQDSARKAKK